MPPSALYRQFERLVADGFPEGELRKDLEIRVVPLYDYDLGSAIEEWNKSHGTQCRVERELNRGGRLEGALKGLEREWHTWRKVKTLRRLEEQANVPRKVLLFVGLIAVVCVLGMLLIVGGDELINKQLPRFAMFVRQTLQDTGDQQQQQQQHNQPRPDDGFKPQQNYSGGLLPKPPAGFVSWVTWGAKQMGIRDIVANLRGSGEAQQQQCSCGEYSHTGHQQQHHDEQQQEQATPAKTEQEATTEGDDESAQREEPLPPTSDDEQQQHQQEDHDQPPLNEPTESGKRFISRAVNVFRKATGTLHVEETARDHDLPSTNKNKKRKAKGILQPAFLLEASEDAYQAHITWLQDRFDPPLPVVEMVWRDLASAEQLSDFLFWNTGWGSIRGSGGGDGAAACCVILSLPNAIAPIARVRNVTRNSAVPLLVEKLSSIAAKEAFEVQGNVGCRAIVVARADPTSSEIRGKKTYKRMRSLFASFIL